MIKNGTLPVLGQPQERTAEGIYVDEKFGKLHLGNKLATFKNQAKKKSTQKAVSNAQKLLDRIGVVLKKETGWWKINPKVALKGKK